MTVLGAGIAPAGACPAGYGTPSPAPAPPGAPYPDPVTGLAQSGYQVGVPSGDYQWTADGRQVGCPTVRSLVQHAVTTLFNSSAVAGFGLKQPGGVKGPGYATQVSASLSNCLSQVVALGWMEILSIVVFDAPNPDGTIGVMQWKDLTAPPPPANAGSSYNEVTTRF